MIEKHTECRSDVNISIISGKVGLVFLAARVVSAWHVSSVPQTAITVFPQQRSFRVNTL